MKKKDPKYRKCLMLCRIIGTYLCLEIMCFIGLKISIFE